MENGFVSREESQNGVLWNSINYAPEKDTVYKGKEKKLPRYLLSELGRPKQCQTPRTWPMLLCLQNRPRFQERPEDSK